MDSELIQTFCAATGAEPEVATRYLQVADNNVDNAVLLYFENGGASLGEVNAETAAAASAATSDALFGSDEVRAPIAARRDVLVEGGGYDEMYTTQYNYSRGGVGPAPSSSIFHQHARGSGHVPFRDFAQEAAEISGGAEGPSRRSRLAELFKPPFEIMHTGSLDSAREAALEKGKWVLVNLQDVSDFKCQALNRDVWRQEIIKDVIKRDFVFSQTAIDTNEGARLASMYNVESYPFVAAINPKTGELKKKFKRISNMADALEDLTNFIVDNPMARRSKRSDGSEASMSRSDSRSAVSRSLAGIHNMSEEDQLAAAIAASELESRPTEGGGAISIETDSEPESYEDNSDSYSEIHTISSYEDDEEPGDDERPGDGSMDVDDAFATHENMAEAAGQNTPDAWYKALPSSEPLEPAQGSAATRIQLRFPNGQRVVRRFSKFDAVASIFQYIKATLPEAADDVPEVMFMNKQLSESIDQTIEEAKLTNASLVVDI
ncbi:UBX domain protein Ubx2 [Coemansia sp. RSA 1358]|uniref:UBX domain protein Ubx2 n=1 Tax=Coemansia umbellata TaxID=1424467 RepID=A0ABQ8PKZ2_9FUNG|nr:UBX domain protein Ubx2 [Coemansia umbellata]KAJ2621609.1 UBX domain protein Ubx2 [Coemansia sp. RSA 1358]